jgi:hypothetical protein
MKNLNVSSHKTPCSEKWSNFIATPTGGNTSDSRLLRTGVVMLLLSFVSIPNFASINFERQQINSLVETKLNLLDGVFIPSDFLISGVVKSENGELMPGVNIYLKDSHVGTVSDATGKFEFPKKLKSGDILIFSFIGYEKLEYMVTEEPAVPLEITLKFDTTIILGKVAVDEVYGEKPTGLQLVWNKICRKF